MPYVQGMHRDKNNKSAARDAGQICQKHNWQNAFPGDNSCPYCYEHKAVHRYFNLAAITLDGRTISQQIRGTRDEARQMLLHWATPEQTRWHGQITHGVIYDVDAKTSTMMEFGEPHKCTSEATYFGDSKPKTYAATLKGKSVRVTVPED